MMKIYYLFLWLTLGSLMASCSSDSNKESSETTEPDKFQPTQSSAPLFTSGWDVSAEGSTTEISFSTNRDWVISVDASWCEVDKTRGTAGAPTVMLTVHKNGNEVAREATVVFQAGKINSKLVVRQQAAASQKPDADALTATFPQDFTPEWVASVAGKEITILNPLFVTNMYWKDAPTDTVTLSSEVLRIFTEDNRPSTTEYPLWVKKHAADRLKIASTFSFMDADQSLRVGSEFSRLKGKLTEFRGDYLLTLTQAPEVKHRLRTSAPTVKDYNLKVMSFNAEHYYLYNKIDLPERQRQHAKILAALKEVAADVYALCEIEQGDFTVGRLCQDLNQAVGEERYAWLTTPNQPSRQAQTCVFIYDQTRVTPYLDFHSYGFDNLKMRYIAQCFELKENGARVILTMNHFKAKDNKNDLKDGQGGSSARRLKEAKLCLEAYQQLTAACGDEDVLVLGDLNSYSMEDPIREFESAGYTNQLKKHAPQSWSYVYRGEVGYLDHSLSSQTLSSQVVCASPWDINASEPDYFGYKYVSYFKEDPYRSSDHNPIITWLNLK